MRARTFQPHSNHCLHSYRRGADARQHRRRVGRLKDVRADALVRWAVSPAVLLFVFLSAQVSNKPVRVNRHVLERQSWEKVRTHGHALAARDGDVRMDCAQRQRRQCRIAVILDRQDGA